MWAVVLLTVGCSAGSGGAVAVEAGGDSPEMADTAPEARAEAGVPDAPADVAPEAATDAGEESTDDATPIYDAPSPFEACSAANPPGDGGTVCVTYAVSTDGSIDPGQGQDAAGPEGEGVSMACTVGEPCTACIGGALFEGFCYR